MTSNLTLAKPDLLGNIRQIIDQARTQVQQTVNSAMVQAYWHIGRLIVEDEQQGQARAEYGTGLLQQLSQSLTAEYGKGFDITNLRKMRQFYLSFPNRDSVRLDLSWTHYRVLIRLDNETARLWYRQYGLIPLRWRGGRRSLTGWLMTLATIAVGYLDNLTTLRLRSTPPTEGNGIERERIEAAMMQKGGVV